VRRRRVLADGLYGWTIESWRPFEQWLERAPAPIARLARRVGFVRGVVLFAASVRHDAVAVVRTERGWRALLLLRAVFGRRRKLVAAQFIAHPLPDRGIARLASRVWIPIDRAATRRALLLGHVMTAFERDSYPRRYGMPGERFALIPFPLRGDAESAAPPADAREDLVVSAGRAHCDWPTLFAAAEGADWRLAVVCSAADFPQVRRLNDGGRAEVRVDVPREQVQALLRRAGIAVIAMRDRGVSQGQIRLLDAVEAGAAVVVSDVSGVREYVEPDATAIVVPPEDPLALRDAVEQLRHDRRRSERLAREAFARATRWTGRDYLAALERRVEEALDSAERAR
jgi:glycosyltransferase involved in cell wall biosynthesis